MQIYYLVLQCDRTIILHENLLVYEVKTKML